MFTCSIYLEGKIIHVQRLLAFHYYLNRNISQNYNENTGLNSQLKEGFNCRAGGGLYFLLPQLEALFSTGSIYDMDGEKRTSRFKI